MLVQESDLYLYHLTLKRQTNYVNSCIGHFIDREQDNKRSKDLQLCIATETHIELYDVANGTLRRLVETPIFATLTTIESFRIENSSVSLLAMTSDWLFKVLVLVTLSQPLVFLLMPLRLLKEFKQKTMQIILVFYRL